MWLTPRATAVAQHGERRVTILGRSEYAGPGELHGAVADATNAAAAESKSAGLVDAGHERSPVKTTQS